MRMTTIHAQAERKRQDRSVCRAEKRLCRARMLRVRGLIHPTSAVCATTDTARGEKRLPSEQNQAILKSSGRPLGECRFNDEAMLSMRPTEKSTEIMAVFNAMADRIRALVEDRPILFFINPGNWGDSLIREGAEEFLKHYDFLYRVVRFKDIMKGRRKIEDEIAATGHSSPVLVYNGNGAFTSHYAPLVEQVAKLSHHFDTSIFLPSTYALDLFDLGFPKNSLFFARDKFESQEQMPSAQFCHDMAFFLNPLPKYNGQGDLWCLRRDAEQPEGSRLPKHNIDLSRRGRAHTSIGPFLDRLSRARVIHTNRLHIGIAGALLGRDVRLYGNDYFKIRAIYHSSIEPYFPNVRFETAPEAIDCDVQKWYHRLIYR